MSRPDVAIIDSGGANIASLRFALERLDAGSTVTADPRVIESATHVVLPGVGAAANAMKKIRRQNLADTIRRLQRPVLGICLGLHLLSSASEEEETNCLGIFPGTARKLAPASGLSVPNMGWCSTHLYAAHALLEGIEDNSYFYYVHSYALPVAQCTLATAEHSNAFSAVVGDGNFFATQFHPERSSAAGARLLANFLRLPA